MKKTEIQFLTKTAILLALTIVFQTMGRLIPVGINSQFIVGPLVNAALIVSAAAVGIWGGGFIALAAPFGAILTGAQISLPFAPFIALGNLAIVLGFYLLMKRHQVVAVIAGSIAKFALLTASVNVFVRMMNTPVKQAEKMLAAFTWPQLITALIGGALALAVIKILGKNFRLKVES